jgi:hypothetical protein
LSVNSGTRTAEKVELENIGHKNLSVSVSINNLSQEKKMIIAKTEEEDVSCICETS